MCNVISQRHLMARLVPKRSEAKQAFFILLIMYLSTDNHRWVTIVKPQLIMILNQSIFDIEVRSDKEIRYNNFYFF